MKEPTVQWLNDHAQLISAVASIGMLLVWVGYLHLFYLNLRRERRVRVLIQQTGGIASNATCEIVNMSGSSIDIACVLLAVRTDGREAIHRLAEIASRAQREQDRSENQSARPPPRRRGPYRRR